MKKSGINKLVVWVTTLVVVAGLVPAGFAQTVAAPVFQVVSIPAEPSLPAGGEQEVVVTLKNTGTTAWLSTGANATKVGTAGPYDRSSLLYNRSWLSVNRLAVAQEGTVSPGQTGTFRFMISGGGAGGRLKEKFSLVTEGVAWAATNFELSANIAKPDYRAQLLSESSISLELKAGETRKITTRLKNIGTTLWQGGSGAGIKLGTASPFDHKGVLRSTGWLTANRVAAVLANVEPQAEGTIEWEVQAPAGVGSYKEEYGVVAEGVAWLAPRITVNLKVLPAIYRAEWVQQSPTVSVAPDGQASLWVDFRNTGNVTWQGSGSTPLRLGTSRKQDRVSQFYDSSWVQPNRAVAVTPASVAPGEIGRFSFQIKAPSKVGKYREYFQPVMEGVAWLNDVGLYWDINVEEELSIQNLMRVGLTSTTDQITVSGNSFSVRRGTDRGLVRRVDNGSVTINPISGGYSLSTGEVVSDYLRIVPINGAILTVNTSGISSSYNSFRGIITIQRSSIGNVWVVNHLELEDYMKGIAEVPEGWPREAQMAQMVAARTYGVKKRSESVPSDIFDVYDDTRHQVYYGYDYEVARPSLAAAAEATRGLVMKYAGQPISAYFFSDSGGATESSYNVWGKGNPALSIPYLQGVSDPYAKPITWSATLTQAYLKTRFDQDLQIAAVGSENILGITVTERFPSNRIKTAVFSLSSGRQVTVPFDRFDYLTNNNDIKSMNFNVVTAGDPANPDFVFTGLGWGHGVGLAQWGAKNMADQGKNFREILSYYFTGISIEQL